LRDGYVQTRRDVERAEQQVISEEEAERIRETRKVTNKRGTTKEDPPRERASVGRERREELR